MADDDVITLLHGTASSNVSSIKSEGLRPRRDRHGNWPAATQHPSKRGFVYLAAQPLHAQFYAARTALLKESKCAIISATVPTESLYPDENFFAEKCLLNVEDLKQMQKKVVPNKDKWNECLEKKGLVCFKGKVPKTRIVSVDEFPIEESPYYSFVRHFKEKTLNSFEVSFQIYLHLINEGWFKGIRNMKIGGMDLIRALEIVPQGQRRYRVSLGDNVIDANLGW